MSVKITVPDEIAQAAQALSARNGETPERIMLNVLRTHLLPISAELQAEFEARGRASDEETARTDRQIPESRRATQEARLRLARQLLAEVEGQPDDTPGMLDATEAVRQLRAGRHS